MKFLKSQGVMIDVKPKKKKVVIRTYASRLTGALYMLLTGVPIVFPDNDVVSLTNLNVVPNSQRQFDRCLFV